MAIQYVGGNTGKWAGATSGNNTVSLTALTGGIASSASSGDFVVAAYATGSAADRTLSITDGTNAYTLVASELYVINRTTDTNLRVAYKRLTGADASVTFGPTGNAADAGAAAVQVWRGVDPTNPLDVAAVTAVADIDFSGRPNPAAITPTTNGSVIIAVGGAAAATGAVFTSSNLSNFRTATSADTHDAMIGIGSYAWSSGAFDPAQFGGGTTGTGDSWAAVTLALRPEPMQQYTMPSDSGSFQATGSAAGLLSARKAEASAGAFTLIGSAAGSLQGIRLLSAGAGAFSAAGGDTEYRQYQFYPGNALADFAINGAAIHDVSDASKTLQVDAGTYAATGGDVTLKVTFVLQANGGSVTAQGGDAALKRAGKIAAGAGAYTFAGQDAGLRRTFKIISDAGSFTASGTSAGLIATRIARADAGAYVLTGKNASTLCGRVVQSGSGSFYFTGFDAEFRKRRSVAADPGSFTATGGDTEYRQYQFYPGNALADFAINGAAIHDVSDASKTLQVDAGTYAATGGDVTLKVTFVLQANGGSVTAQGGDAALKRAGKIAAGAGAYTFAGQDAGLRRTFKIISDAGSFTASGTSAGLIATRIARADAGAYVLTGKNASTLCGRVVQSGSGSFYFTGFDAEFRKRRSVAADPGSFTATGGDATLAIGKVFWVDPGEFYGTGGDAELLRSYKITSEAAEYLVSASGAELFTGVFAVVQDRTFNVKSDRRLFLSLAQDTTMEVPANLREIVADPQPRDLHVPHEPRVFIVPKDSRKFAASSGERDF